MYYAIVMDGNSRIEHHGIKGQKWGVRRYQNEDGTLTPEGIEHYRKLYKEGSPLGVSAGALASVPLGIKAGEVTIKSVNAVSNLGAPLQQAASAISGALTTASSLTGSQVSLPISASTISGVGKALSGLSVLGIPLGTIAGATVVAIGAAEVGDLIRKYGKTKVVDDIIDKHK